MFFFLTILALEFHVSADDFRSRKVWSRGECELRKMTEFLRSSQRWEAYEAMLLGYKRELMKANEVQRKVIVEEMIDIASRLNIKFENKTPKLNDHLFLAIKNLNFKGMLKIDFESGKTSLYVDSFKDLEILLLHEELFQGIDELRVSEGGYSVAEALSQAKFLHSLESLHLGQAEIGDKGVALLAKSKHFSKLKNLSLSMNNITSEGAAALAQSKNFPQLERLDLSGNTIGESGAQKFFAEVNFSQIKSLNLNSNNIGSQGVAALANAKHFDSIEDLNLNANNIGDSGLSALAQSSHLGSLKRLSLKRNKIENAGVVSLAGQDNLKQLEWLDLSANEIGDQGALALIEAKYLGHLKYLDLGSNFRISLIARDKLKSAPYLREEVKKKMFSF